MWKASEEGRVGLVECSGMLGESGCGKDTLPGFCRMGGRAWLVDNVCGAKGGGGLKYPKSLSVEDFIVKCFAII
jgi:hypothetical protein